MPSMKKCGSLLGNLSRVLVGGGRSDYQRGVGIARGAKQAAAPLAVPEFVRLHPCECGSILVVLQSERMYAGDFTWLMGYSMR